MKAFQLILLFCIALNVNAQGPYEPSATTVGTDAISVDSNIIVGWATGAILDRGYMNISNPSAGYASVGNESNAIGKAQSNGVVSLGDGGSITLTFDHPIKNVPGPDFAVFENGFDDYFLELAFVEVSSDGANFFRFESVSLTDTSTQVSSFDSLDATNLKNLAGKYRGGFGVPYDLNELNSITGLDINNITHVRVIDVIGSVQKIYASRDSEGNMVNDPWPTEFPSGGFDFDAVGVIGSTNTGSPESTIISTFKIYPNPIQNNFQIEIEGLTSGKYALYNANGQLLFEERLTGNEKVIQLSKVELELKAGIHFIQISDAINHVVQKVIIL